MPTNRLWKVTDAAGRACHGGTFDYTPYLPTDNGDGTYTPGPWLPVIPTVVPCASGYHACRDQDVLHWLHERVWAIEARGAVVTHGDKVVLSSFRFLSPTPWDETAARLFAVECAAEVLPLHERNYPNDSRVADALVVATLHALGDATDADLDAARYAAWDAARAAARDAARAAARAAAWAAAWDAARAAARDAARAAARDAARAAARDAARAAARARQTTRLLWWLGVDDAD